MPLSDFDTAAKMRDVITVLIRQVLADTRPAATYGTVSAVDRDWTLGDIATVSFPGGGAIRVPMRTLQPNAAGAVVRIVGESGDRYIDDVVTASAAYVRAARVRSGTGFLNADYNESFHAFGVNSGYSFMDQTGLARWLMSAQTPGFLDFSNGSTWALANVKLRVGTTHGQVLIAYDGHVMSNMSVFTSAVNIGRAGIYTRTWNEQHICLMNNDSSGLCGISFLCGNTSTAPIICSYGALGESIQIQNNAHSAYVPILASAFTVSSSRQFKREIEPLEPSRLGRSGLQSFRELVRAIPAHRWQKAVPAQHIDPETKLSRAHVCGRDCESELCGIGFNDSQPGIGLVAEEVAEVFPEAVFYDENLKPHGLDLGKLVGMLWATVQELSEELEAVQLREMVSHG